ncbi:type I polyketide synthase [Kitasatospora sp. NPDC058965]|uniref:type I polyketide synthase n=1 Tax=Kitasatospora sp. NPDC058965 TaxID=3346682 RepID=UPI0036C5D63F
MPAVAIVGLDCAFPGAPDPEAYWDLLMRGADAVGPIPDQRWDPREVPGGSRGAMTAGGFLDAADVFDNAFFAIAPREAAAMDPQQRLLLQCAWRALEDSGRAPRSLAGQGVGVFVGMMGSEWAQLHLPDHTRVNAQFGVGSTGAMAANRISHHLGLTGPSLVVDTACSSSLVAVHLAVNSLLSGECDLALAGGVNLVLTPSLGVVYGHLGLASAQGHCLPFGAEADGIVRSDGVGLVALRRLEDALADRQPVHAVIRGTAVNQDGRSNGITAPNPWAQQAVLEAAYRRAGVTADQIRFVETHGTGTVLGDMLEARALGLVHGVERELPCAIGSVKGNLGHTEGAAGIAGLIKAALSLRHRMVPASRFGHQENRQLRLADRGLSLLKAPLRLAPGEVLAGVSSFGIGGTNAHAVLAAPPRPEPVRRPRRTDGAVGCGVFTLTGDTPEALRRNLAAAAESIGRRPRGEAASLCWSSNRVKTGLAYRAAVVAGDTVELAGRLRAAAEDELLRAGIAERPGRKPVTVFLFSGEGAACAGMTARLYGEHEVYRRLLGEADAALGPYLGVGVRDLLLAGDERAARGALARPAQFAVGYALAGTLRELGVQPAGVLGHGVGEYAAAVHAGALDLDAAARLLAAHALPERADFASVAGTVTPAVPALPFASTLRGRLLLDEELDAAYWSAQAFTAVHFHEAFAALNESLAPTHVVEIGARIDLLDQLAGADLAEGGRLLAASPGPDAGARALAELVAELYLAGLDPAWEACYPAEQRTLERLVPYAFSAETRYWKRPWASPQLAPQAPPAAAPAAAPRTIAQSAAAARPEDQVTRLVIEAVREVGDYEAHRVTPATRLYQDLGFDSVMLMQLKDVLEARMPQMADISVQQLLPALNSVATIAEFLNEWITVQVAVEPVGRS